MLVEQLGHHPEKMIPSGKEEEGKVTSLFLLRARSSAVEEKGDEGLAKQKLLEIVSQDRLELISLLSLGMAPASVSYFCKEFRISSVP